MAGLSGTFANEADSRSEDADSPFGCCTSTAMSPSAPPRTFSIYCLRKFPFPFSCRATPGSQHGPDLCMISSSDSSWKTLQQIHEEGEKKRVWLWSLWHKDNFLLFSCSWGWKFSPRSMQSKCKKKKSHIAFICRLEGVRYHQRNTETAILSVHLRLFPKSKSKKKLNYEAHRQLIAATDRLCKILAVVMQ